ncbi:MFS transporter [Actinomadura rubrobrunea]|uniref:MFS transporter n=1 Tax=Actinomadura rubrobrunea TaxID=115335 RepID=A0A9W6PTV5_9ACTN|nr:MFS transporter [Actinomadura rubrobrunea]GLW62742.1 MFS transporter [Actinomadura rubrobrunea]
MSMPLTSPTAPPSARTAGRRRWLGMVVISLGVALIVVDATIVSVLLPQIIAGLGLTGTDAEWVTSVYALVFAALLIPFGRAGDLYGRRRLFVTGVGVFTAASAAAALAQNGSALIGARGLQGVGAAMILPAALSTVHAAFTGRHRAVAFGVYGSLISGMAALGPLLGGAVASAADWRWAFGVNLLFGAALVAGALLFMPETRAPRPDAADGARGADRRPAALRDIDWAGGALSVLGLGALVCGLIEGQNYGWWTATRAFSAGPIEWPATGLSPVPIMLGLAAVLLTGLVLVERARAAAGRPVVLDLALFRIAGFRRGNLALALVNVGELGLLFVLPLFLLGVHGSAPLQISLAILPLAAGAFLAGGAAGRLARRRGPHRVVQLGLALEVAAVAALAAVLGPTTGGLGLAPWMLLYGLGLGLTAAQLTNVSLADVPAPLAGQAAGTQSTSRQVGAALGIAFVGAVFTTALGGAMADRLQDGPLPAARQAAIVHELRHSAGTYARELHGAPGMGAVAKAADESLAAATQRAVLATGAVLALGLVMTLRLGPGGGGPGASGGPHRPESRR